MQARLILLDPPAGKRELKLTLPATVGRSRDARIKVVHSKVSRLHCEFFERDGLLHVRDLGSTNGTYVGEARVEESPVEPGDTVTIGAVKFQALYEPGKAAPRLVAPVFAVTDTIRKADEATYRASSPAVPPKPSNAQYEGARTQELATSSMEEYTLLPLEPPEQAAAPVPPVLPAADDDSLFILPPSPGEDAATGEPPTELQWRISESSSPPAADLALRERPSGEAPLEASNPAPDNEPAAKPLTQEDKDFDEFFKSLNE